ncbi:hypothetical protein ACQPYA_03800 [Micromonospora sp. CA-263727]|uniref:hypothetical protein n=1 Tax=Micromonospora sp. CA-263727 TaxID=3239967 RepID=UPI003D8F2B78
MSEHPTATGGSAPIVRPGDVIDVGPGVDRSRPAGYRLHVISLGERPHDGWNSLRGYTLNKNGARRRTRDDEIRRCWLPIIRLKVATVVVPLGTTTRPVPLAVAPDEQLPLPVLPVLSRQRSATDFGGAGWSNSGAYLAAHLHRHQECGHLSRCGFPDRDEPCQAYQCHHRRCRDCLPSTDTPTSAVAAI